MWRFLLGFGAGVYCNQKYHLPDVQKMIDWIQDQEKPRIISFTQLQSKNYKVEDTSNAEWSDIKITPIKIN